MRTRTALKSPGTQSEFGNAIVTPRPVARCLAWRETSKTILALKTKEVDFKTVRKEDPTR